MVKFKINNTDFEAPEESTILDVARGAGFMIPTLCHNDGLPHYSSCMVCMVKNKRTGNYIPSCSALVQDGMDIDISGEEVISLRKKALELLFSEHRAECEAPCRVVCPAGYNIPLFNRLISGNDLDAAIKLTINELNGTEIKCTDCPGYCENACRRKKIDIPVSIRNMKLFIYRNVNINSSVQGNNSAVSVVIRADDSGTKQNRSLKRFTSRIGKLEEEEQKEWLKECSPDLTRIREIEDFGSASSEAASCMHCDCRAAEDCRLRDLAEEFLLKDPRGKIVNAPIEKKINRNTGLIFENAKCIKCGLCVRLCENFKDEPSLCFMHRGFVSIISEPLTVDFDDILLKRSKEVIEICPTGALSKK